MCHTLHHCTCTACHMPITLQHVTLRACYIHHSTITRYAKQYPHKMSHATCITQHVTCYITHVTCYITHHMLHSSHNMSHATSYMSHHGTFTTCIMHHYYKVPTTSPTAPTQDAVHTKRLLSTTFGSMID